MLDNIKAKFNRFWTRKVLRKIHDYADMETLDWADMNGSEQNAMMENLYIRVTELEHSVSELVSCVSKIPAQCDKCSNYDGLYSECFKCESSGVITKSQAIGWPW